MSLQTPEQNFMAHILKDPDDDAPRLIYADWLDEHGQPERAEFIRIQFERQAHDLDYFRRKTLEEREAELIEEHGAEWQAEIGLEAGPDKHNVHFSRGFIDSIDIDAERYIEEGGSWRTPLRAVCLWRVHGRAKRLSRCSHLSRLTGLCIFDDWLDDDDVAIFAGSPHPTSLKHVSLGGNRFGDGTGARFNGDGLLSLAQADFYRHLLWLSIQSAVGLSPDGLASLFAIKSELALKCLSLRYCRIEDDGLVAMLSSSSLPRGLYISLENNRVTGSVFRRLSAVRCLPGGYLNLSHNPIERIDLGELAVLLGNNPGLRLSMRGCPLAKRVRKAISLCFPERAFFE